MKNVTAVESCGDRPEAWVSVSTLNKQDHSPIILAIGEGFHRLANLTTVLGCTSSALG